MKFQSLRSSLLGSAFALLAAFLVGSCGGGGASSPGPQGGPPQNQPSTSPISAGVEYTITIAGGRPPYTLSSSEPSLLAVPAVLDGHFFKVIPNNPGVIDNSLPPGALPVRTVTITMRDSVGSTAATSGLQVGQNFFTGYGVFYSSNCAAGAAGAVPQACAGGETAVTISAVINGNRFGNRTYQLEILRGPFFWVHPNGQIAGNTITVTTDHEGTANAIFRVNNLVQTQIGVYRITDVATGTSVEQIFTIDGIDIATELEILPNEFTFTGAFSDRCGTGSADFLVFDGAPPYTAVSSFPEITITARTPDSQPGRFTLTVSNPFICLDDATIVVTDSNNARGTVTVTTEPGSEDPPPPALSVTPGSITLSCGQSGSVSVIGGADTISVSSADPALTATVAGRTVTVTRTGALPATPPDITGTITITDGATGITLSVIHPTACS